MSTVATMRALARPTDERAQALLEVSESQWFDRKSSRIGARELADALIGFANAEGGVLVVGLANRKIEGIDVAGAAKLAEWQQAAHDFTDPPVPARTSVVDCADDTRADHLLVIEVEASERVHANRRDEVFLRVGDENRRLTFAQRQELHFDKGQSTFEATTLGSASTVDLDEDLLGPYVDAVGAPDPLRLLSARGLLTRSGELTTGAALLFTREPQQWFPEAHVRVLRYRGTERGTGARQQLVEDIRIDGSLPTQLVEAREAVIGLMPARRALTSAGRFERVGLIPEEAWLEGLVNAVVHRSYSISGDHIRVDIFDDRIEIESPGRFPGVANTGDMLQLTRFARNPRIARVLADLQFGQELGEGIRRIYDEMRTAGLEDPDYFQSAGSVRLTLTSAPVDRELEARLPEGARTLVRLIRLGDHMSTGDLTAATKQSRPVVIRQLKALENAGLIEWVGQSPNDPRAHWKVRIH